LKSLWLNMLRRLLTPIDRVPFSAAWIGVRGILVALREAMYISISDLDVKVDIRRRPCASRLIR